MGVIVDPGGWPVTSRRKPGVCNNTLALPIEATDEGVLSMVEGEVLGTRLIEELLAMVDRGMRTSWTVSTRSVHVCNQR
jgi:hypothetical protein